MDGRLRALERQVLLAPDDPGPRASLRAALERLAPLHDRARWAEADPAAQDLVLATIGRLLAPAYEPVGAAVHAAGGARHRIGAYRHVATGVVVHLLPGGTFRMGSARRPEEGPPHPVVVEPLLVGRLPVLQGEWDRAPLDDDRSWVGADLPIEGVTWRAARRWLEAAGGGLRLPSEAEWEWACRAGTTTEYFWGDAVDDAYCWHGEGPGWRSHPPADHADRANAFGLVDPSGNVAEWVEDGWGPYPAATAGRDASPLRRGGPLRVIRGGDAFNRASYCRSAWRGQAAEDSRGGGIGVRAARSLPC